ncbi:MAG: hypothetical protein K6C94_10150 [Candidatus Gastranaerophilales bacterium]|nr:hypothetical protein [Candidatus Gastranaerophilales bacterium]
MSANLKKLNKSEKMKLAEKHLQKYVSELKIHFDFSDFQVVKLLEQSSKTFQTIGKNKIKEYFLNLLRKRTN